MRLLRRLGLLASRYVGGVLGLGGGGALGRGGGLAGRLGLGGRPQGLVKVLEKFSFCQSESHGLPGCHGEAA